MIDPTIALQYRNPVVQDPTETQARAMQLANGRLELQQRMIDMRDQQTMRQAYMESGGDMDKFQMRMQQLGASPKAIIDINKQMLAMREAHAKLSQTELENAAKSATAIGSTAQSLLNLPDESARAAQWPAARAQMIAQGHATPDQIPQVYPGQDWITLHRNAAVTAKEQQDLEYKSRETAAAEQTAASRKLTAETTAQKTAAELPGIEAGTKLKQMEAAGQAPIQPYEQARLDFEKQKEAREAKQGQQQISLGAGRLAVEQQNARRQQQQYDATYGALLDGNGKPLDPEAAKAVAMQDPMAVAVANYQSAPPNISRGGPGVAVMRKALAINPSYNAQNWQAQKAELTNFTSGKVANELSATNTALSHVGLMTDAIDALNNGDIRMLNSIANRIGVETGKTPAAVFKTIVGKVGPELGKAYGEATGSERGAEKENFDPNLPPQTLKANAAVTAKLLQGKIQSREFQWKQTMGDRPLPLISPEAKQTLDKLVAPAGGGFSVKDPRGVVHTFKSQQDADNFKRAAGIQ